MRRNSRLKGYAEETRTTNLYSCKNYIRGFSSNGNVDTIIKRNTEKCAPYDGKNNLLFAVAALFLLVVTSCGGGGYSSTSGMTSAQPIPPLQKLTASYQNFDSVAGGIKISQYDISFDPSNGNVSIANTKLYENPPQTSVLSLAASAVVKDEIQESLASLTMSDITKQYTSLDGALVGDESFADLSFHTANANFTVTIGATATPSLPAGLLAIYSRFISRNFN